MSYKINYSTEEKIKLAKDDSVEKLYESRKNQRTVRVLTVCAYVLTVSLAAIILSAYYVFLWVPSDGIINAANPNAKCEKIIIPEILAVRLANNSEVSAESFYTHLIKELYILQNEAQESFSKDQLKISRNDFNNFLKSKATQLQNDARSDRRSNKNLRKKMIKKKKFPDDEDFNIDMESSGDKSIPTTNFPTTSDPSNDLNDTTIIFDQEQD